MMSPQEQSQTVYDEFIDVMGNLLGKGVLGTPAGHVMVAELLTKIDVAVAEPSETGAVKRHENTEILRAVQAEMEEVGEVDRAILRTFDRICKHSYETDWRDWNNLLL